MRGSKVKLEIERVASPQPAVLDGVVRDQTSNPIPGVIVAVRDEVTKREVTAVTDVNGAFTIASLNDGIYRVEVTLEGLKPARIEHLQMKASEVTHANVVLRAETTETITVGAIAVAPSDGISATYSQELINKLPL